MAFGSTLTITIDSVDKVLKRIEDSKGYSLYRLRDDTEELVLTISHNDQNVKGLTVYSHNAYLTWTIFATDTDPERFWSTSMNIRDRRTSGPSVLNDMTVGFAAFMSSIADDLSEGLS